MTTQDTTQDTSYDVTLRLWRGDQAGGELRDYTVACEDGEVVLDAIHRVQATQAGDLAVRWNCKAGKRDEPITVTPLRTFPVIRDLVTDVSFNFEMAKRVPPFAPRPREADGTYRMAQEDIDRVQEFHKCIECFLCQNVCHVIRDHEENKPSFAGPRMFIRYAELEMHPLETGDRRELLRQQMGLGLCNITKCCTEVCPEHINITDNAIIPLKERVADVRYDPITWLGDKIRRRDRAKDEG
jgi:succinate dehydrogenase / fumarate reductase iron-sulfur subunit